MGLSRPRLQTCQLSPRAGWPEGLVELSAVEVWTKRCLNITESKGITISAMFHESPLFCTYLNRGLDSVTHALSICPDKIRITAK